MSEKRKCKQVRRRNHVELDRFQEWYFGKYLNLDSAYRLPELALLLEPTTDTSAACTQIALLHNTPDELYDLVRREDGDPRESSPGPTRWDRIISLARGNETLAHGEWCHALKFLCWAKDMGFYITPSLLTLIAEHETTAATAAKSHPPTVPERPRRARAKQHAKKRSAIVAERKKVRATALESQPTTVLGHPDYLANARRVRADKSNKRHRAIIAEWQKVRARNPHLSRTGAAACVAKKMCKSRRAGETPLPETIIRVLRAAGVWDSKQDKL